MEYLLPYNLTIPYGKLNKIGVSVVGTRFHASAEEWTNNNEPPENLPTIKTQF
jgi:hypothetical protein